MVYELSSSIEKGIQSLHQDTYMYMWCNMMIKPSNETESHKVPTTCYEICYLPYAATTRKPIRYALKTILCMSAICTVSV